MSVSAFLRLLCCIDYITVFTLRHTLYITLYPTITVLETCYMYLTTHSMPLNLCLCIILKSACRTSFEIVGFKLVSMVLLLLRVKVSLDMLADADLQVTGIIKTRYVNISSYTFLNLDANMLTTFLHFFICVHKFEWTFANILFDHCNI